MEQTEVPLPSFLLTAASASAHPKGKDRRREGGEDEGTPDSAAPPVTAMVGRREPFALFLQGDAMRAAVPSSDPRAPLEEEKEAEEEAAEEEEEATAVREKGMVEFTMSCDGGLLQMVGDAEADEAGLGDHSSGGRLHGRRRGRGSSSASGSHSPCSSTATSPVSASLPSATVAGAQQHADRLSGGMQSNVTDSPAHSRRYSRRHSDGTLAGNSDGGRRLPNAQREGSDANAGVTPGDGDAASVTQVIAMRTFRLTRNVAVPRRMAMRCRVLRNGILSADHRSAEAALRRRQEARERAAAAAAKAAEAAAAQAQAQAQQKEVEEGQAREQTVESEEKEERSAESLADAPPSAPPPPRPCVGMWSDPDLSVRFELKLPTAPLMEAFQQLLETMMQAEAEASIQRIEAQESAHTFWANALQPRVFSDERLLDYLGAAALIGDVRIIEALEAFMPTLLSRDNFPLFLRYAVCCERPEILKHCFFWMKQTGVARMKDSPSAASEVNKRFARIRFDLKGMHSKATGSERILYDVANREFISPFGSCPTYVLDALIAHEYASKAAFFIVPEYHPGEKRPVLPASPDGVPPGDGLQSTRSVGGSSDATDDEEGVEDRTAAAAGSGGSSAESGDESDGSRGADESGGEEALRNRNSASQNEDRYSKREHRDGTHKSTHKSKSKAKKKKRNGFAHLVQHTLERTKHCGPNGDLCRFVLRRNSDGVPLVAAQSTAVDGTYVFSCDTGDFTVHSPAFVGQMTSSLAGTRFKLYDHGMHRSKLPAAAFPQLLRREHVRVVYETNVLGQTPNQMKVSVPVPGPENEQFCMGRFFTVDDDEDNSEPSAGGFSANRIAAALSRRGARGATRGSGGDDDDAADDEEEDDGAIGDDDDLDPAGASARPGANADRGGARGRRIVMITRKAKWNEELGAWTMNFRGRVVLPSKKNFIITDRRHPDVELMIFGKRQKNEYACDFAAPLTPICAVFIALSAFASKLAVT